MRLIDADEAKSEVQPLCFIDTFEGRETVYRFLNRQKTVDAVPVVRCKDCKYAEPCPGAPLAFRCRLSGRMTTFDFYCAEGVKKNAE